MGRADGQRYKYRISSDALCIATFLVDFCPDIFVSPHNHMMAASGIGTEPLRSHIVEIKNVSSHCTEVIQFDMVPNLQTQTDMPIWGGGGETNVAVI